MTNYLKDLVVDEDSAVYDADTIQNVEGETVRLKGVDAPEAPTLTFDDQGRPNYLEGLYHEQQTAQLKEAIDSGYKNVRPAGTDVYGRTLGHLETDYGYDFAEDYLKEGLIGPSKYSADDINIGLAYAQGQMDTFIENKKNMPDWRKEEILKAQIQNVVPLGPIDLENAGIFSPIDRDYKSTGSFDFLESIEYWWMSNKVAYQGIASLFDKEGAKRRIEDVNAEFGDRIDPNLIVSLEQVDSAGDGLAWLGNNLIIQGPDFAIIAGSGSAGAAIGSVVPVVGTAVGGFIGTTLGLGYTWLKGTGTASSEIIETTGDTNVGKSIAIGSAITLLDRFGAKGALKPTEFLEEGGVNKLVKFVSEKEGISEAAAKKIVDKESSGIIRKFYDDLELITEDFASKKAIALRIARETGKKGLQEGATELSQESIQYLAIHGVPETAEEWKEMGFRLADAAAAGSAIGAVYQAPQSLRDRAEINDWREGTLPFDYATAEEHEKRAYDARKLFQFKDVTDLADEYRETPKGESIQDRAKKASDNYLVRAIQKIKKGQFRIGDSAIRNAFHRGVLYNSQGQPIKSGFILANIEGAMQNITGHSLFNAEEQRVSRIRKNNPWLEDPQRYLGLSTEDTSNLLDKLHQNGLKLDQTISKDEEAAAKTIIAGLTNTHQDLVSWRGFQKEDAFTDLDNPASLLESNLPNIKKIRGNSQEAIKKLSELRLGIRKDGRKPDDPVGVELATEIIDNLLNFNNPRETAKLLHDIQAFKHVPEIYSDNAIDRLADKILHQTKSDTQTQFRGHNMEIFSNLLNEMEREGVDADIVNNLAADLIDQEAKHNKTFGRLENDKLRTAQDFARTATTLGVMDMSMFAQGGEAVLAAVGTDKNVVKQIGDVAHGAFKSNVQIFKGLAKPDAQYDEYQDLGYHTEEVIQQHGVEYDSRINQAINKRAFQLFQTAQITDGIRLSRMVVGMKVISNLAGQLIGKDLNSLSKADHKVLERLQYYGADVPSLVSTLKEVGTLDPDTIGNMVGPQVENIAANFEILHEQWDEMLPKFIDEFAVRVKPGSRPSWFEDKRFGLPFLTQYLSFTAHWSANQLPRFYNAYTKGGGQMAYSAFSYAASAIMIAYLSQFLKDWLIHGDESPYLKEKSGAIERALLYSGLFGWTGEGYDRFISGPYGFGAAHKALGNKDRTLVGELFGNLLESPTISHGEKIGEKVLEGKFKEAGERGLPFGQITVGDKTYLDYLLGE